MRSLPLLFVLAACGGQAAVTAGAPAASAPAASPPAASPPAASAPTEPGVRGLVYPAARRSDTVDDYHGTRVADPYRWLEDVDSPETRAWVQAEQALANSILERLPGRKKLEDRLTQLWNYERFSVPYHRGKNWFFKRNTGLQNQDVLYVAGSPGAEGRVLLDPNSLSADGTVALHDYRPSRDGTLLLYGLATAGSDWVEYHVKRVADGKDLPDVVKWNKFGGAAFAGDGTGFYYTRYDEPKEGALKSENRFPKVYLHRLGAPQDKDELVYERKDQPDWLFSVDVTDDGRWLLLYTETSKGDYVLLSVRDTTKKGSPWIELVGSFDRRLEVVDNVGSVFYLRTDLGAPRQRLMTVDAAHPEKPWKEIIPESDATLVNVALVHDQLIAHTLRDAHSVVLRFDRAGKRLGELALPGVGSAKGFTGQRGDREVFYSYASYAQPTMIYRYDLARDAGAVLRQPKLTFDPGRYETRQIFATSKDGTKVPIFLTGRKGRPIDGQAPVLMYGYGGFDIDETPAFSVRALTWMEETDGLYADVVLRGGGEYGEAWHEAAKREKKQNVFDDFIAAAEHLVKEGITRPDRIAASGGSNGGLLVGAILTQRPDLIGCALPAVGVLDMMRFQKFTIGWTWAAEYGSSDEPEMVKPLLAYSPLQNIKPGTRYPATLVTTADHDDRVFPAHSFKFTAALQAAQAGTAPILIRVETRAGHGAGKPTSKIIQEVADVLAFAADALHVPL